MRVDVLTLFPPMFAALSDYGITGRALKRGIVNLKLWNPRDFTHDVHRTVDDRPYGGGPGMVMKYAPLRDALLAARADGASGPVIYLSPQGEPLRQQRVREFGAQPGMILVAGRYEGIDERFIEAFVDREVSLGDYVVSGGELAAMTLLDAVVRTLPDVLGDPESAQQDSFEDGLLDCPHYTRPEVIDERTVPAVLLSGDHAAIRRWRRQQSVGRTWQRRPELLSEPHSAEVQSLLTAYRADQNRGKS